MMLSLDSNIWVELQNTQLGSRELLLVWKSPPPPRYTLELGPESFSSHGNLLMKELLLASPTFQMRQRRLEKEPAQGVVSLHHDSGLNPGQYQSKASFLTSYTAFPAC